jgi:predicted dehydrogenase
MGRHHARAARWAGGRVVGIVDPDAEVARALAGKFSSAGVFADINEALRLSKPDVAHVCTPLETHADIARALAAAGVHAFVEKPLAGTAGETAALLSAFAAAKRAICPVHQYAFQSSVEEAAALIPDIGALQRISFDICSAGGGDDVSRLDQVASEILPHPLSMLQRLVGADLDALDWALARPSPGEWLATATLGQTLISISISLGARPTCFATRLLGSRKSILLDNFHDFATVLDGRASRATKIVQPLKHSLQTLSGASINLLKRAARGENAYPGLRTLVGRFYAAIRNGTPPPILPSEALAVAATRDRLLDMARSAGA